MDPDDRAPEPETEFELPFGWAIRVYELGFFSVVFAISLAFLVLTGLEVITGGAPGLIRTVMTTLLGSIGAGVSLAGGRNALQLLQDERAALTVTEEGILNRTYWNSTTLAPWDEVVRIRKTRMFFIAEIVLSDPEDFRSRQILPVRIMMRITSLFGIGSLPVYLPQLAASSDEVMRRLSDALDAKEFAAIHEHLRLEATVGKDLPTTGSEEHSG
ncbi:MAG: hypothetical protein HKN72_08350 [Gemmatimonadetes bacterium]|nr:hypothetical protein [Gemmatimonadota bacterium]